MQPLLPLPISPFGEVCRPRRSAGRVRPPPEAMPFDNRPEPLPSAPPDAPQRVPSDTIESDALACLFAAYPRAREALPPEKSGPRAQKLKEPVEYQDECKPLRHIPARL